MTDLHCHILPGIDDGAKDVAEALQLLELEAANGINQICFTSHFNSERTTVEEFLAKRAGAYETLQAALAERPKLHFSFKLGAEVYFSPGLMELDLQKLSMGDTGYLLVEFPTTHRPQFISDTFYEMQCQGLTPLIAHVERYPYAMHHPELVYEWINAGAFVQINASSVLKDRAQEKEMARFLKWNLVHVLSTDTHSLNKRPPRMKDGLRAVERLAGKAAAQALVQNGDDIFAGQELDVEDAHLPRKVLGFWV